MTPRAAACWRQLEEGREHLLGLLRVSDESALARPTANQRWNVRDLLAHLIAAEAGLGVIARRAISGEPNPIPDFDLHRWNARQVEKRRASTLADLLREWEATRSATRRLCEEIQEEWWEREADHPLHGRLSLAAILAVMVDHQREHSEEILQAIREGPAAP